MTSTRPGRGSHLRHVAADNDRLRGALQQPVYRWERQWCYPEGDRRQHFRILKWVKTEQLAEIEPDREEIPAAMTPRDLLVDTPGDTPASSTPITPANTAQTPSLALSTGSVATPELNTQEAKTPSAPTESASELAAESALTPMAESESEMAASSMMPEDGQNIALECAAISDPGDLLTSENLQTLDKQTEAVDQMELDSVGSPTKEDLADFDPDIKPAPLATESASTMPSMLADQAMLAPAAESTINALTDMQYDAPDAFAPSTAIGHPITDTNLTAAHASATNAESQPADEISSTITEAGSTMNA